MEAGLWDSRRRNDAEGSVREMYRKCVTEISARHQKQVEESLLALMQETPYEEITVTRLCQAAGVTRRVFYHLFNSKTDALHALVDHTILCAESYRLDIPQPTLRFFLYWKEQRPLFDALRKNQLTSLLLERMIENVLNEDYDLRYWLKDFDWNTGTDIIIFNISGIVGLTYSWYYSGYRKTPEEMAQLMLRLVRHPGE